METRPYAVDQIFCILHSRSFVQAPPYGVVQIFGGSKPPPYTVRAAFWLCRNMLCLI